MSRIKVVTDSAGDIPPKLVEELGIEIVPLSIRFGTTEYRDVIDLSVERFWELSETQSELPQTAAPSIEAFKAAFEKARADGYDGVVCICLSSKLSATFQSAQKAGEEVSAEGFPVAVIDSLLATFGEGGLAVAAARNADKPLHEVAAMVQERAARTRILGALDTLENLRKGGRIGAAAATLGSILAVKPIIEVVNGEVQAHSKQRTHKRAIEFLYDMVRQVAPQIEEISVISAMAPDEAEFVAELRSITGKDSIMVSTIGPVIGAHAGPRTIGVCITLKPTS
ncbi:MAG: DegV family protein [Actinomycetota bacterium]|nr:DegV family protein [Actinomycetota bacterium]MDA8207665.1 DegV family protein [Actinomycetota bacterium]